MTEPPGLETTSQEHSYADPYYGYYYQGYQYPYDANVSSKSELKPPGEDDLLPPGEDEPSSDTTAKAELAAAVAISPAALPVSSPQDWTVNHDNGRQYWFNVRTGESSWVKPEELKTDEEKADKACLWKEFKDEQGRVFYFNMETKQSSWTKPDEIIEKEKREAESKSNSQTEQKEEKKPPSPLEGGASDNSSQRAATLSESDSASKQPTEPDSGSNQSAPPDDAATPPALMVQ